MTLVIHKQIRSTIMALILASILLAYILFFFVLYMGWGWEEVVRSVPSPALPPIPPFAWDAFRLVLGALALAIGLAGGGWLWQRRQPIFTPARLAAVQQQLAESELRAQRAEQRAAQAEADAITADAQREVSQSAMQHLSAENEQLREARRQDLERYRQLAAKAAARAAAANAPQVQAEPAPDPALPADDVLIVLPPERVELLRDRFTLDGESFMRSDRRWRRFLQVLSANAVLLSYSPSTPTPLLDMDVPESVENRLETGADGEQGSGTVEVSTVESDPSTVPVRSFIYLPTADDLEVCDDS